ncbi:DUF4377 domain-containing protein [uncultured Polaribacter sp.]|uniref:DUF4377 domain-containing protein n=1 Tax=uncultured Polaribacter sp. TaxID=174711 RepID=UPI002602751C|nr:DUF4377 domain-containing protein [uncultured Polaribacter sp.]
METKKRFFRVILIAFSVILFFASCENSNDVSEIEKTYIIASKQIDCQGVGPQKCFLIKENQQESWQNFYSAISGFEYEEGFEYEILVSEKEIENPPQDSSSIAYTLIKVISKVEKTSENLPN